MINLMDIALWLRDADMELYVLVMVVLALVCLLYGFVKVLVQIFTWDRRS